MNHDYVALTKASSKWHSINNRLFRFGTVPLVFAVLNLLLLENVQAQKKDDQDERPKATQESTTSQNETMQSVDFQGTRYECVHGILVPETSINYDETPEECLAIGFLPGERVRTMEDTISQGAMSLGVGFFLILVERTWDSRDAPPNSDQYNNQQTAGTVDPGPTSETIVEVNTCYSYQDEAGGIVERCPEEDEDDDEDGS